jgi:uncharacterized protein YPO0396
MAEAEDYRVTALLDQEKALRSQMDEHRAAIAELADERRRVLRELVDAIGITKAKRELNISSQAIYKALGKPDDI